MNNYARNSSFCSSSASIRRESNDSGYLMSLPESRRDSEVDSGPGYTNTHIGNFHPIPQRPCSSSAMVEANLGRRVSSAGHGSEAEDLFPVSFDSKSVLVIDLSKA